MEESAMNALLSAQDQSVQPIQLPDRPLAMLDCDLATLYGTKTKVLNQQVKRNQRWFDDSFCFRLTKEEANHLRSLTVTSEKNKYKPICFTQAGCIAAAFILRSTAAYKMRNKVVEIFARYQNGDLLLPVNPEYHELLLEGLDYRLNKSIEACKNLNRRKYEHLVFMNQSGEFTELEIAQYLSLPRRTVQRFIEISVEYDRLLQQIKSEKEQTAIALASTLPIHPAA
jgi:hypothetical protein